MQDAENGSQKPIGKLCHHKFTILHAVKRAPSVNKGKYSQIRINYRITEFSEIKTGFLGKPLGQRTDKRAE